MSKSDEVAGSKYVDGINEERFDNFLADLRSGKFQQGQSTLHSVERDESGQVVSEKFCCLGVACVRPAAEGVIETSGRDDKDICLIRYDGYETTDLPIKVADWLGIPEDNRVDESSGSCDIAFFKSGFEEVDQWEGYEHNGMTAIGFNDRLGKSFEEIADAFELEFTKEEK